MTPGNLREILFDIFPRKVSAEPDEAPNMVRELQEFWKFLQRELVVGSLVVVVECVAQGVDGTSTRATQASPPHIHPAPAPTRLVSRW
jgi:hypothetical protein